MVFGVWLTVAYGVVFPCCTFPLLRKRHTSDATAASFRYVGRESGNDNHQVSTKECVKASRGLVHCTGNRSEAVAQLTEAVRLDGKKRYRKLLERAERSLQQQAKKAQVTHHFAPDIRIVVISISSRMHKVSGAHLACTSFRPGAVSLLTIQALDMNSVHSAVLCTENSSRRDPRTYPPVRFY